MPGYTLLRRPRKRALLRVLRSVFPLFCCCRRFRRFRRFRPFTPFQYCSGCDKLESLPRKPTT